MLFEHRVYENAAIGRSLYSFFSKILGLYIAASAALANWLLPLYLQDDNFI